MVTVVKPLVLCCLLLVVAVLIWSFIHPFDMLTWYLEAFPVLVVIPLLALTYRRFPLTSLLYILITIHCIILLVGAHYTYARVPLFDWLAVQMHFERNHYDRLGHVIQGFVPAMAIRELLLRTSPLKNGIWLFVITVFGCLGISALYEIIEWAAAIIAESGAISFLGIQGDIWDTQKDMLLAAIGAIAAQVFLTKIHLRQLASISQ